MEYAPVTKEFGASSCFWVAGQYKDHGCRYELLGKCIRDSKEKGKICASAGRGRKTKYNSTWKRPPAPFTSLSPFQNGKILTNEILSPQEFLKIYAILGRDGTAPRVQAAAAFQSLLPAGE